MQKYIHKQVVQAEQFKPDTYYLGLGNVPLPSLDNTDWIVYYPDNNIPTVMRDTVFRELFKLKKPKIKKSKEQKIGEQLVSLEDIFGDLTINGLPVKSIKNIVI